MQELLEKNTFGGTRAAELLVAEINKTGDKKIAKCVSKLFSQYSKVIHEIDRDITSQHTFDLLISLWNSYTRKKLEDSNLPDRIKSLLLNIEVTLCRKIRKEYLNK